MKVTIDVCDVCQSTSRPTTHFDIARNGEKIERDLCEEHSLPILNLFNTPQPPVGPKVVKKPAAKRAIGHESKTVGARIAVTTIEDIAKLKGS